MLLAFKFKCLLHQVMLFLPVSKSAGKMRRGSLNKVGQAPKLWQEGLAWGASRSFWKIHVQPREFWRQLYKKWAKSAPNDRGSSVRRRAPGADSALPVTCTGSGGWETAILNTKLFDTFRPSCQYRKGTDLRHTLLNFQKQMKMICSISMLASVSIR